MARLTTNAKKKKKKALFRVEKVVILEIRKKAEQQKKWQAKVGVKTDRIAFSTTPKAA